MEKQVVILGDPEYHLWLHRRQDEIVLEVATLDGFVLDKWSIERAEAVQGREVLQEGAAVGQVEWQGIVLEPYEALAVANALGALL
ncbi:MAG: hypothetical protein KatS3mg070_1609 [Meiothermus sp.]|jgi:coproporphyrinogen III oxidase|uniref:hypothetical protein n=1 Tax=Meiothermus TaxID=65551 RepID=UPI0021DD50E7|nr:MULTISPECIES: hypothetical protein [Meiothermus]MCL6529678.1 hypothetical protein [Meiothermus ruber]GIW28246.1 MAG: hypothetical protein KatS3mg070_1609 [Meiothermus sp.]